MANIVLVHGGFVDGSGWEPVYQILRQSGHRVTVVQNPTTSLADDVAGDGDGFRTFLKDSPGIDVRSAPPSRLQVTLPSVARPDEAFRITVAALDPLANAGFPFEGVVLLSATRSVSEKGSGFRSKA
jgi:hypothetical protein